MEAVLLIGLQGSGKSTLYTRRFADTHVRINLDMLRTRHREGLLLEACLAAKQPFVVDNTNPAVEDRARYIAAARAAGFAVHGYYLQSKVAECLARNAARERQVPEAGVLGTYNRLVLPRKEEGFDRLYYVRIEGDEFVVSEWRDEV